MLVLQAENFIGNLGPSQSLDGFLSIEYTAAQFDEINQDLGISVAVQNSRVAGYLCACTFSYGSRYPILAEMIRSLQERTMAAPINGETTFIYGPVCISRSMRGSGVLGGLFGVIHGLARPRYRQCVLFVSEKNTRSLHAHLRKLGMKHLGTFVFAETRFHMLGAVIAEEDQP